MTPMDGGGSAEGMDEVRTGMKADGDGWWREIKRDRRWWDEGMVGTEDGGLKGMGWKGEGDAELEGRKK